MKRRACIVVSSEMTVRTFLVRQLAAMAATYDVTVVVNTRRPDFLRALGLCATLRRLPIERRISLRTDIRCLVQLFRLFRAERFDLVHSLTPKAGLLAMLAARAAGVPVRIHTFTGQVWATRWGLPRAVLRLFDRLTARAATFTLADSPSQRDFLVREGVVAPSRVGVAGPGSVSGVDPVRFRPDAVRRRDVRARFGIGPEDVVLLFVGRVTRDKGVLDLARAFAELAAGHPALRLLVAGPDEEELCGEIVALCGVHAERLHLLEFTTAPEELMAASDILCLPSYREGFGMVVIEAAAAGLPVVASRIYGVVDAVAEGETGLLHEPGDVAGQVAHLRELLVNAALRAGLGAAARARAARDFSQEAIVNAVLATYERLAGGGDSRAVPRGRAGSGDGRGARRATTAGSWYPRFGKRLFDLLGAGAALVLLLPVAVCVAWVVRVSLGSPVLFRQTRPGRHGVPFVLLKFRTMAERQGGAGELLPDADRLTRTGRLLRAASLDEIPQLWNVLRGDMSLVGPRPLLMQYLPLYSAFQARRHEVRPGITGLAQTRGRNALGWDERFELDVRYVDHHSLLLDLRILAGTCRTVISGRGITQAGRATVDCFEGNGAINA